MVSQPPMPEFVGDSINLIYFSLRVSHYLLSEFDHQALAQEITAAR